MGFEGYFVLGATILLIAFVIPALSRRREVLASAPLEDRYSEDLRMLRVSDARGADRPDDDGQRGSVFFKRPEVDMAQGRVTKDVRELARERARVRARMSKRAASLQRGFFGGAVVAALAVVLWVGVAVGFASPLLAGVATVATLAYGAAFVYIYRKATEADGVDREELERIVAEIGPRRAQGRKVATDAARRSAKKKADVEARASLAQAARGARVEVRESAGAHAAARRAAARKAAAQKAAAAARIEGELRRRFERSKAASRMSNPSRTDVREEFEAFSETRGEARGTFGAEASGEARGRPRVGKRGSDLEAGSSRTVVGSAGAATNGSRSRAGRASTGDGRSGVQTGAIVRADLDSGSNGFGGNLVPGKGGNRTVGNGGNLANPVSANTGLRAGSGTGFSSSRVAPVSGTASLSDTAGLGAELAGPSHRAEMPSYTLKPGAIERRVVEPYAAPTSATAPVPYRPQVIGERYDAATGVVMPSAPGEVPLSPAETREAQAKVERAVEASVVSHSSEVLSGGSVLDALLERRRA